MFRHVTSPAYSFCGYFRSTSICRGHEILQHLEKQCDCQTVFNFFLSSIILHSKGFCSFHVLWQLNNNLYSTIKVNKNPDNINRYLSLLRRKSFKIMRKHLDFRCPRLRQIRHRRHDSFSLQRPRKAQNCLRFAGSTISRYRPYRKRSSSLLKGLHLQQRVSLFNSLKSSF